MKVYITKDELWPVYYIVQQDTYDSFVKKTYPLYDIPDHIVNRYEHAYEMFMKARADLEDSQIEAKVAALAAMRESKEPNDI